MDNVEVGKDYIARNGKRVRIYAIDGSLPFPVHGAVLGWGGWGEETWTPEGGALIGDAEHELDLVGPWVGPLVEPKKRKRAERLIA